MTEKHHKISFDERILINNYLIIFYIIVMLEIKNLSHKICFNVKVATNHKLRYNRNIKNSFN